MLATLSRHSRRAPTLLSMAHRVAKAGKTAGLCAALLTLAACAQTADRAAPATAQTIERIHTVQRGDTVFAISRRYGVNVSDISRANNLGSDYAIRVGQTLQIPKGGRSVAAPSARAAPAPRRTAAPAPVSQRPRPVIADVSPMARPADGPIISAYGARRGGVVNDGVDIGAPAGAPVRAADAGEVAFVSDPTSPLGSVVLVQHDGGIVTIYGRIAGVQVRPGQRLAKGQQFASVAPAEAGGRSRLHFEIRRGSDPIDPTPYI